MRKGFGVSEQTADEAKKRGSPWLRLWAACISDGVPRRSLAVALLVGTLLNVINQGDILIHGGSPELAKLVLTYVVPYAVATYGAVSYRLRRSAVRPE